MARNKRTRTDKLKARERVKREKSKPLQLKRWDSPILKKVLPEIASHEEAKTIPVGRMIATCEKENGVGLGANQVGIEKRVIAINLPDRKPFVMFNPEIVEASDEVEVGKEGCLSYPGVVASIERSAKIMVTWRDREWAPCKQPFRGFAARVIQHEVDHLDGVCRVGDEWRRQKESL